MNSDFTIYPAIDLRHGQVVRLAQGDPTRQTTYGDNPAAVARQWLDAGATWLHVVNLDGAFGEAGQANQEALRAILQTGAQVQFGGGLRTLDDLQRAIDLGVSRAIIGTAATEDPALVEQAVARFGAERVGVGIDARDGRVRVHGWLEDSGIEPLALALQLRDVGVTTIVFTNIAHDGVGHGVDIQATRRLAEKTGLTVIASGGVSSLNDLRAVRAAGLPGVIVGRALYEGQIDLKEALESC